MSNLTRLGDVYEQLLNLGFIKPMIVRNYNDEYILVHIFSDNDADVCKITYSKKDKEFTILITNFQKDAVDCYKGDPIEFIIDRFIEANGLDKLDIDTLVGVINRTCNNMIVKSVIGTEGTYTILCKSFKILISIVDDMFKVSFYAVNYNGPTYKFKTGFEAFKFIYYIRYSRINQFSYNKTITPLIKLAMDLYLKFGNDNANKITTLPDVSIENTVVKLQSNNGYMSFSIDTLDGKNAIKCEIYRYDNKISGIVKSNSYDDILDFVDREYTIIK